MSCTWKVSCSPAIAGRVVVNDHPKWVQHSSPSVVHCCSSMATPSGNGSGSPTGEPWTTNGPLPTVGPGVADPVPRTRSPAMRTPVGRTTETSEVRSEEHTSELQSRENLVCRLLLEKKKN